MLSPNSPSSYLFTAGQDWPCCWETRWARGSGEWGPGSAGSELGIVRKGLPSTVLVTMVIECRHQWALSSELWSGSRIGQRWALKSRAGRIRPSFVQSA